MKHMMYYLEWTNDATNVRFGKYRDNFWAQYSAINLQATNKNGEIGSLWWTTDQGGSAYDGYSQESGINAVLAAAAWGGCQI
ncbi:hypothetical protein B0H14DRAFT_2803740 [Mycena olivaceomarginata]|nr:hypothetical protein B0H14DRAFT_2803740 [Mycena olivaceomarginata]